MNNKIFVSWVGLISLITLVVLSLSFLNVYSKAVATANNRVNNPDYACNKTSDCQMDSCAGARSREYWEKNPGRQPCISYMNYTATCIKNTCVEVPKQSILNLF